MTKDYCAEFLGKKLNSHYALLQFGEQTTTKGFSGRYDEISGLNLMAWHPTKGSRVAHGLLMQQKPATTIRQLCLIIIIIIILI